MSKLTGLLLFLLVGKMVTAQTAPPSADSAARRDSALLLELKENQLDNIPVISLDESNLNDGSSQSVSSVLTAGRDPFFSAISFNFSPARFRVRGYDADFSTTYMNGIPMDNLDNGFAPYSLWGGLNDVMRNREVSLGLRTNTFGYGDIGISTSIDARASKERKQTQVGYALSNRNYNHRISFYHGTGISKKGWAFVFAGSFRGASEGYIPGTYYNGYSYYVGIDKRLSAKQLLSVVAFGAPTENGRQSAAVAEIQALTGDKYYNPAWGYQNGKKRNANVGKTHQPVIILTHDLRFNSRANLVTAAGYSFGNRSTTALDWYNTADPRPDYYRYLPSYQLTTNLQQQVADAFVNDVNVRQVNWQRLYDVNRSSVATINNADGVAGKTVTGNRSRYIVEERVINTRRLNLNTVFNSSVGAHAEFSLGAAYQWQRNNYFKRVNDLLGGDFYVDLNQFAERDFPANATANQNDINNPNHVLYTGDKFGYNYDINISKASAWSQGVFKFNKVDFFVAGEFSTTSFWRVGYNKNGLFPNRSFGKSTTYSFSNFAVKGGVTYKINGRNYLYLNGSYLTKAPFFDNVFISPRTRDIVQDNITSETIETVEGGYVLNAPKIKARLSGYYTRFQNQLNVLTFYDDQYRNFVNYALNNIDKVHFGGEFGFEAKVMPNVSLNGAASVGRYYYDSRQSATVTQDNSSEVVRNDTVYSNNFRVGGTPQEAYSLGVQYRSPRYWFAGLTGNYFDQMWLDFNPLRRTYAAVENIPYKGELYNLILAQQRLKGQYTLDFFAGYSYKLPRSAMFKHNTFLVFNLGVNNILNNRNLITGGYEQLRFDFVDKNIDKFPPKLFYAYGINFFTSVTLRF